MLRTSTSAMYEAPDEATAARNPQLRQLAQHPEMLEMARELARQIARAPQRSGAGIPRPAVAVAGDGLGRA